MALRGVAESSKPRPSSSRSTWTARTERITPAPPGSRPDPAPDADAEDDFIPLPSSHAERVRASGATVLDQIEALESSSTSDSGSGSDSDLDSDSGSEPGPKLLLPTENNSAITQANRAASERPYDPQVWLDLAAVQSQLLPAEGSKARQAVASAQLSVLDRGIERVERLHASGSNWGDANVQLHLAHMAVSELVHPTREDNPWAKVLPLYQLGEQEVPHLYEHCSLDTQRTLWRSYLTHLSSSSQWSLSSTMQAHSLALTWLSQLEGGEEQELALVEIQVSAAHVLRDAGYTERGFALLQVQMALCITLSTMDTDTVWDQAKRIMGDAWDGEAEDRWGEPFPPTIYATPPQVFTGDELQCWMETERLRSRMLRTPRRSTNAPATQLGEDEVDLSSIVLFSDVEPWVVSLRTTRATNAVRYALFGYAGLPLVPDLPGWTLTSHNDFLVDVQVQDQVFWPASLTDIPVSTQGGVPVVRLDAPFACPIPLLPLGWDYVPVLEPLNDTGFSPLPVLWLPNQIQLWNGLTRASVDLGLATVVQVEQLSLITSILDTSSITQAGKAALGRSTKRELWSTYALGTSRALVLTDPDAGLKALIACLSHPSLIGPVPLERLWIQLVAHVGLASEHPSSTANGILRQAQACGWRLAEPGALDWLWRPELSAPVTHDALGDVHTPSTAWIAQVARCIAAYISPSVQSPTQRVDALLSSLSGSNLNASDQDLATTFIASWVYSLSYSNTQPRKHDLALPPPLVRKAMVSCTELSLPCAPLLAATQRGVQRLDGSLDVLLRRLDQLGAPNRLPTYAMSDLQEKQEKERAHLLRIYLLVNLLSYDTRKVKDALDQAVTVLPHSVTLWTMHLRWLHHHLRNVRNSNRSSREVRRTERDANDVVWRSIVACPGSKAVWVEAMALYGSVGKDVSPLVDSAYERELRLYVAPPGQL